MLRLIVHSVDCMANYSVSSSNTEWINVVSAHHMPTPTKILQPHSLRKFMQRLLADALHSREIINYWEFRWPSVCTT